MFSRRCRPPSRGKPPDYSLNSTIRGERGDLHSGEGFDDPDEVLLQQLVVQLGQMGADDGVVPQLRFVLRQCLRDVSKQTSSSWS